MTPIARLGLLVPVLAGLLALAPAPGSAQPRGEPPPGMVGGGPGRPMFLEHLFRPELVMRHQGALELTQEQKTAIAAAIKETQDRLAPLQWDLEAKSEAVAKLVEASKIDVDQTLAVAAQVIALEGQVKQEHLRLLLKIKNVLTPAQQEKLAQLRPDRCGPERGRRPPLDRPPPSE